jgi:hypothetical protein
MVSYIAALSRLDPTPALVWLCTWSLVCYSRKYNRRNCFESCVCFCTHMRSERHSVGSVTKLPPVTGPKHMQHRRMSQIMAHQSPGFTQSLTEIKRICCVWLKTNRHRTDCLDIVGYSTSNNPIGLHGLLRRKL